MRLSGTALSLTGLVPFWEALMGSNGPEKFGNAEQRNVWNDETELYREKNETQIVLCNQTR